MRNLFQLIGIALVMAAGFSLTSCVAVDVDPDPTALDQAEYDEAFGSFSQADEASFEAAAEHDAAEVDREGYDLSCGGNCDEAECMACTRYCLTESSNQQLCLNYCLGCGGPCFC